MSPGLSPIRVLTVDEHPLVREGIGGLISMQPDKDHGADDVRGRRADPPRGEG